MPEQAPPMERARTLGREVGRRVSGLQHELRGGGMGARASLAHLRQAVGRDAGSSPEVWELTVAGLDAIDTPPSHGPSRAERAAHLALGLYAVHQRGEEKNGMHQSRTEEREGLSLGAGLARLRSDDADASDPLVRRFTMLVTGSSFEEIAFHLRSLVTQLAGENVAIDYGRLATDLYLLQFPAYATGVRLAWARDFYRVKTPVDSADVVADDTTDPSTEITSTDTDTETGTGR